MILNHNVAILPLAARMRPQHLQELVGQTHLISAGKPLYQMVQHQHLHSMILWGPPGIGKTTLAYLLSNAVSAEVETLSAVNSGVKDIRQIMIAAELRLKEQRKRTVLFIDEIHRFNKAQQDAFLPYVENGTIILIGATTENPSFELNNALLSRVRVFVLKPLNQADLLLLIDRALTDPERGLGQNTILFADCDREKFAAALEGDARRCYNALELAYQLAESDDQGVIHITADVLQQALGTRYSLFDKQGDAFYDAISALHKAVRGSSPDAALYWFYRMIAGGCDPHYLARRMVRMSTEDIGNADPRALTLTIDAWHAYERLGSPEGELALAQALVYLAVAPKSNAVYVAAHAAKEAVAQYGSLAIPVHLRNAPTALMKSLGYGKEYRYAHDEPHAYAAGEKYFPDEMPDLNFYEPVDRGLEIKIKEKLRQLKEWDKQFDRKK